MREEGEFGSFPGVVGGVGSPRPGNGALQLNINANDIERHPNEQINSWLPTHLTVCRTLNNNGLYSHQIQRITTPGF